VPRPTTQVPQTQVPATIGSKLSADEVKTLLTLHNQSRTEVGVSGLSWSSDAAAYIQNWVDQLAATSCNLQHRQPNQYGENLFMGSMGYGVGDAVKAWDNEKKAYNGAPISPNNFSGIGHYTQMVWRSTTQVGCAKASCNGMVIIGCNYDPPGNMIGQKPY
jgi:pathogenesis-related protein 1